MKGSFVRNVFEAMRRYVRVFMQQGRVQLDADAVTPEDKKALQEAQRRQDTDRSSTDKVRRSN